MRLMTFTSVVLMGIILKRIVVREKKATGDIMKEFWDRERLARSAKAQPIDDLDYIKIPPHLPLDTVVPDGYAKECQDIIQRLSESRIINLQGMSNTDVRLKYGNQNFETLSAAEANYLSLSRAVIKLAGLYEKFDHPNEAKALLEFLLDTNSDMGELFIMLFRLYDKEGSDEGTRKLKSAAGQLPESRLRAIVRQMENAGLETDFMDILQKKENETP